MSDAVIPTRRASVFISFAKPDEAIADYVQNALNRAGYQASTFTSGVTAGDRWISSISLSLETADSVVILISKAALESHWVLYEVSASIAAVEKSSRKRIIPVALSRDLVPSGILAQYQWVFTTGAPQEVADAVIQALDQPFTPNKALERAEVLLRLERVQEAMNIERERWEDRTRDRNSRATRRLIPAFSFVLLVAVIVIVVITRPNAGIITAVTSLAGTIFGAASASFALISNRDSARHGRGTSDDRPRS